MMKEDEPEIDLLKQEFQKEAQEKTESSFGELDKDQDQDSEKEEEKKTKPSVPNEKLMAKYFDKFGI